MRLRWRSRTSPPSLSSSMPWKSVRKKLMIYLKLQHLNPHLLFSNLNFIILFQAQKETLAHSVKAVNQFVQFLVGTAGFQINLCSIGRIQNIDFMT